MWTDIRCNMTEIYCINQKMSTISVIMEIMFVIAIRHSDFDSLFNLTRAEPSRKEPSKWDFGRERELARIKKTLKAPA